MFELCSAEVLSALQVFSDLTTRNRESPESPALCRSPPDNPGVEIGNRLKLVEKNDVQNAPCFSLMSIQYRSQHAFENWAPNWWSQRGEKQAACYGFQLSASQTRVPNFFTLPKERCLQFRKKNTNCHVTQFRPTTFEKQIGRAHV